MIGSIVVAIFVVAICGVAIFGAVLLIWLSHQLKKAEDSKAFDSLME